MVHLYKNDSIVKYVVGQGQNTGSFPVSEEPNEVRVYSETYPNGYLLTRDTDGTIDPDEWDYDGTNVLLGEVKTDLVIAFAGGAWMFEDVTLPVDSDYVETLTMKNDSSTLEARDITVSPVEIFDYSGSDPSMIQLSLDNATWASSVVVSVLNPLESTTLYVKVATGSDPVILRNLAVRLDYTYVWHE